MSVGQAVFHGGPAHGSIQALDLRDDIYPNEIEFAVYVGHPFQEASLTLPDETNIEYAVYQRSGAVSDDGVVYLYAGQVKHGM